MKLFKKGLVFRLAIAAITILSGCSKNNDQPSANTDEAAAARVVGTYKGTLNDFTKEYYNATIIITKESGSKVKIAPKSGEAYSHVTTKIVTVQAILGIDDCAAQDPQGNLSYTAAQKTLKFLSKSTSAGDVIFSFEGTKQ